MKYKLLPYETYEGLCIKCGDPVVDATLDGIFNIPFCERHIPFRERGYDIRSFGKITAGIGCPHDPEWIMLDSSFSHASCTRCMWGNSSLLFYRNKSETVHEFLN